MANVTGHAYPPPMKATSNGAFHGDNPLDFARPLAILQICLVLVVTRCLAFLLRPLRQPRVIAEIIGGILLGPSALGRSKSYLRFCTRNWVLGKQVGRSYCHFQEECISPFDYCDIVTSTTHKGFRGPRGGIIFYQKGVKPKRRGSLSCSGDENDQHDFEDRINFAVFPSLQGGPHNNHIAALAIAFKQVASPEYKAYMQQVKKNAQALASALLRKKCRLVTGGTDNHLLLWDLSTMGLAGKIFEKICEMCHITLNKSAIYGDNGAICSGDVRIGTPAMTSRGCLEADFEIISEFLIRAAQIASFVQREHGKLQRDFLKGL